VLTVATLGSLLDPSGPPAGVLAPIGTAHVSADGMRIDLDAPLHFFSWIALSLAQKGP
jgi:hypothetical protein